MLGESYLGRFGSLVVSFVIGGMSVEPYQVPLFVGSSSDTLALESRGQATDQIMRTDHNRLNCKHAERGIGQFG